MAEAATEDTLHEAIQRAVRVASQGHRPLDVVIPELLAAWQARWHRRWTEARKSVQVHRAIKPRTQADLAEVLLLARGLAEFAGPRFGPVIDPVRQQWAAQYEELQTARHGLCRWRWLVRHVVLPTLGWWRQTLQRHYAPPTGPGFAHAAHHWHRLVHGPRVRVPL